MRALALGLLFTISGFLPLQLSAHTAERPSSEESNPAPELNPEMLMYSVVKINNMVANIFAPSPEGGHGSGFYVGVDARGKGLIFTNRHVIEASSTQAQRITVEFNTDDVVGETVRAKLLFVSNLHDFAVLEFDAKKLKRAKLKFPLHLPAMDSPFFDFIANSRRLRGSPVLAIGNPFDGDNVFTYGEITGLQMRDVDGPFIQTQTPINPGNSGGPLISRVTGEVVGINTAIRIGANSTGYATPIGPLMREFGLWLEQKEANDKRSGGRPFPTAADRRIMNFKAGPVSADSLKVVGQYEAVTKAVPDYWRNHQTILVVQDVLVENGLQRDDILIRMNGEVIGGFPYNLYKRLQRSGETVDMEVLRDGKLISVPVQFKNANYEMLRQQVDYVYISGLVVTSMSKSMMSRILPSVTSRVTIGGMVDSAETNFLGQKFPPIASVVVAVNFGGKDYKIESLFDLKKAINENRDKAWIKLRVHRSNLVRTEAGQEVAMSPTTGMPLLDGTLQTMVIPMREVLTPMQFSMHKFKKQFSFDPTDSDTWDWHQFRHPERLPSKCAKALRPRS